jgi:hypothetical protein
MHSSAHRQSDRLPKRFPVGTTYVVEGSGGADGNLRVVSRYVVLPGGKRINIPADLAGPASPRALPCRRPRGEEQAQRSQARKPQKSAKSRSGPDRKKIATADGTMRQYRR